MPDLTEKQEQLNEGSRWDFSDLKRSTSIARSSARPRRRTRGGARWIGEAGPGPSYLDSGSGGPDNDFTNRNTTFMTWNLLHLARMIKDAGGIPAHGNQRTDWDAGCRFVYPNPEHR